MDLSTRSRLRPRPVSAGGVSPTTPTDISKNNNKNIPEDALQTPWRKLSTGIASAFKYRKAGGGSKPTLGDKTNDAEPMLLARRFCNLIESPAHLRLMQKPQLQSVAVIVNDALPVDKRIDVWQNNKDQLRNSIEDVFGFPRTITPQAPRRSSENSRFGDIPTSPVASLLSGIPSASANRKKRHSTGGLPSKPRRSIDEGDVHMTDVSVKKAPPLSSKIKAKSSKLPVNKQRPKSASGRMGGSSFSLAAVSTNKKPLNEPRSPGGINSSSPISSPISSSSPPSSPLASRSTHGSLNRLISSKSGMSTGGTTTPIGCASSFSNLAGVLSPSVDHSRQSSNGNDSVGNAHHQHQVLAEDLADALMASTVNTASTTSGHTRSASTRSAARVSWMGTSRFLDVVREEKEEESQAEDGDEAGRPKKRRRAPEPSASSSIFMNTDVSMNSLPSAMRMY